MRFLLVLTVALAACEEGEPAFDPPLVTGPYAGNLELGPDTRHRLPAAIETISPADAPRFYWYHPEAAVRTITWEVRAETTALAHGTLIHTEEMGVPAGEARPQGMIRFEPTRLSEGGARRNSRGQLEWLPGIYSVKGRFETGDHFATGIFEVR